MVTLIAKHRLRYVVLFILLIAIAAVFCYWPRIFADWDEHTTLYGASRVIRGELLFVHFIESKLPLAQWLFAPSAFAASIRIHRIIQLLVIATTALLLYQGLREIKVERLTTAVLSGLFILLSRSLDEGGSHSVFYLEHFANLFVVSAFLVWVKTLTDNKSIQRWLWVSCFLSCAIGARPNLVVPIGCLFTLILTGCARGALVGVRRRECFNKITVVAVGAGAPFLFPAIPYLMAGEIEAYWIGVTQVLPHFSSTYAAGAGTFQEIVFRIIKDIQEISEIGPGYSDIQGFHNTYQSVYFALFFVFLVSVSVIAVHFFARYGVIQNVFRSKDATAPLVLLSTLIYLTGLVVSLGIRGIWIHNFLMFLPPIVVLLAYVTTGPWAYPKNNSSVAVYPVWRKKRLLLLATSLAVPIVLGSMPLFTYLERQPLAFFPKSMGKLVWMAQNDQKFSEKKSGVFWTAPNGRLHEHNISVTGPSLKQFRIDPAVSGDQIRQIEFDSLVLFGSDEKVLISFRFDEPDWRFGNIRSVRLKGGRWVGRPESNPYLLSPVINTEGVDKIQIKMRIKGKKFSFWRWVYYQWLVD